MRSLILPGGVDLYSTDGMQAALSFVVNQLSFIETQVYRVQYPDIQYPGLVPTDTSAPEWVKSITYYSLDSAGKADWVHARTNNIPFADFTRDKFEQGVAMAGIGYRYDIEEVGQAMMMGVPLTAERAMAANRSYEEFVDDVALRGNTDKGWKGIMNLAGVTTTLVPNDGTGTTRTWSTKSDELIMRDFNGALTGIWTASLQIEMADTVLLPVDIMVLLSQRRLGDTTQTLLDWLMAKNVVSLQTGRPLKMRAVRGLETAGAGGVGRMVVYRNDPQVLKMHIPMPHRFLDLWRTSPMVYDVPGIFRLGGLELRRPGAMRYVDGIL